MGHHIEDAVERAIKHHRLLHEGRQAAMAEAAAERERANATVAGAMMTEQVSVTDQH